MLEEEKENTYTETSVNIDNIKETAVNIDNIKEAVTN
jgi:hypothetical protein